MKPSFAALAIAALLAACSSSKLPERFHTLLPAERPASAPTAVNWIGTPTRTAPVGVREAVTVGFAFCAYAVAPPLNSITAASMHPARARRHPSMVSPPLTLRATYARHAAL